jgi:hypothetical protein
MSKGACPEATDPHRKACASEAEVWAAAGAGHGAGGWCGGWCGGPPAAAGGCMMEVGMMEVGALSRVMLPSHPLGCGRLVRGVDGWWRVA